MSKTSLSWCPNCKENSVARKDYLRLDKSKGRVAYCINPKGMCGYTLNLSPSAPKAKCGECGDAYPKADMTWIPEEAGDGYHLCKPCQEGVEDAWETLQEEVRKNVNSNG